LGETVSEKGGEDMSEFSAYDVQIRDPQEIADLINKLAADSKQLDKVLKWDCRHYYGTHPDDFELVESREDIDKLEEPHE
jgi:hypothetical protein